MVDGLALRSLNQIARQRGVRMLACWNIPMKVMTSRSRVAACGSADQQDQAEAAHCRPADHVQRTEPEGTEGIEAFRAVVHLLQTAPQQTGIMHPAMLAVDAEF